MDLKTLKRSVPAVLLLFALICVAPAMGTLLIGVSIGRAQSAQADPALDAWSALERGEYAEAYKLIKPLAEGGATWAQVNLGLMYAQGQGVNQDYDQALKWFRAAASKGDATAQSCIGRMYEEGHGIPIDHAKAAHWYLKAADQGNVTAQYMAGRSYYRGLGLPKNNEQAAAWLERCAEKNDPKCLNLLGILYRDGLGVEADPEHAVYLICRSAQRGESGAVLNMAASHLRGLGAEEDLVQALTWHTIYDAMAPGQDRIPLFWVDTMTEGEQELAREVAESWSPTDDPEEALRRCEPYAPAS